jgi:hypothetical protein
VEAAILTLKVLIFTNANDAILRVAALNATGHGVDGGFLPQVHLRGWLYSLA